MAIIVSKAARKIVIAYQPSLWLGPGNAKEYVLSYRVVGVSFYTAMKLLGQETETL